MNLRTLPFLMRRHRKQPLLTNACVSCPRCPSSQAWAAAAEATVVAKGVRVGVGEGRGLQRGLHPITLQSCPLAQPWGAPALLIHPCHMLTDVCVTELHDIWSSRALLFCCCWVLFLFFEVRSCPGWSLTPSKSFCLSFLGAEIIDIYTMVCSLTQGLNLQQRGYVIDQEAEVGIYHFPAL